MSAQKTILPTSSSALEVAIDKATATQIEAIDDRRLFDQWHADRCPNELLGWLAWAVSVDDWNADWPESVKRQVIRSAVTVHRKKGTLAAVRKILAAIDIHTVLSEEPPHVFRVTVFASPTRKAGSVFTSELDAELRRQIESAKPARSAFILNLGTTIYARMALASAFASKLARYATFAPLSLRPVARLHVSLAAGLAGKAIRQASFAMSSPRPAACLRISLAASLRVVSVKCLSMEAS